MLTQDSFSCKLAARNPYLPVDSDTGTVCSGTIYSSPLTMVNKMGKTGRYNHKGTASGDRNKYKGKKTP